MLVGIGHEPGGRYRLPDVVRDPTFVEKLRHPPKLSALRLIEECRKPDLAGGPIAAPGQLHCNLLALLELFDGGGEAAQVPSTEFQGFHVIADRAPEKPPDSPESAAPGIVTLA